MLVDPTIFYVGGRTGLRRSRLILLFTTVIKFLQEFFSTILCYCFGVKWIFFKFFFTIMVVDNLLDHSILYLHIYLLVILSEVNFYGVFSKYKNGCFKLITLPQLL